MQVTVICVSLAITIWFVSCENGKNVNHNLPLGKLSPSLGPIDILDFEPTPEDFYRDFIRQSRPVIIRTKNPSWLRYFNLWKDVNYLKQTFGNFTGRVYKRNVWTKGWPVETRMKFTEFLDKASRTKNLYWDSLFPLNSELLQSIPLPLYIQNSICQNWVATPVLLYTYNNASSVLHHDAAENFFFQIAGKKTWLIANYSISDLAYANNYDVQAGLSPINPQNVNLTKFPLVSNIKFYEVTIEAGDFLYVPQYWWHQVRSFEPPIIALGIWAEVFNYQELENVKDVVGYTNKFADFRKLEKESITCPWQHVSLHDIKSKAFINPFMSFTKPVTPNPLLYFGSDEGSFYCVDSVEGAIVWQYLVEGDAGSTPVLSHDDVNVFFADETGHVYSFSADSGTKLWTAKLKDGVVSGLKLSEDGKSLFVASLDQYVYAIDTRTGEVLWKQGPFGGEIWGTPSIFKHMILLTVQVENKNPSVFLLNSENGNIIWKFQTGSPVFASPAIHFQNNLTYILDVNGRVHVLQLQSGKRVNSYETSEVCEASPLVNERSNKLYTISKAGTMHCFDATSLKIIWKKKFEVKSEEGVMSSPLLSLSTNVIYAAVGDVVYALNSDNGSEIWKFTSDSKGAFISSPRLDKIGILYIGCSNNLLYAINAENGETSWKFQNNGPIVSSVAMPNNLANHLTVGSLL